MTLYWMLDSQWPSFFGHLIDAYLKPGGAYFGAKKGMRPLSIVFDYYATGDRKTAHIHLVNQTLKTHQGLKARIRYYNLDGSLKFSRELPGLNIGPLGRERVLSIPRISGVSPTYFVRCQLANNSGAMIVDNVYWQSTTEDDLGGPKNDSAFILNQVSWADFTALNTMPKATVAISGVLTRMGGQSKAALTLRNDSSHIAFFMRAEVAKGSRGDEVLPITYDDNYITLFPGESRTLGARFKTVDLGGQEPHFRVEGYNVSQQVAPFE
ncbi:MAG TPA: hypothetical protein VFL79_07845 [Terriglobia bacterium]|nr:hypothetical protein [Terriglobia bacterium]